MVRHLDLFSGLGGFAVAVHMLGHKTIGFCDNDKPAQELLALRWPGVPIHDDIKTLTGDIVQQWGGCDLITGGFPCQPFSVAGKRRGTEDDRAIWHEMARVIDETRPRYVLGENVNGIVQMELDTVLTDLEGIGYTAWPLVIPATAADAPHRRDRVWIIAHDDGDSEPDVSVNGETGSRVVGAMAHATGQRQSGPGESEYTSDQAKNRQGQASEPVNGRGRCEWSPEPRVGRVADGIPRRVDRLRLLGNSIVPAVAYEVLRVMLHGETP